jgi:hypothetical protein
MNILRHIINRPIYVTSGTRCIPHNREVGGVSKSAHLPIWKTNKDGLAYSFAVDFTCQIYLPYLATIAYHLFPYVELHDRYIHVDNRPGRKNRYFVDKSQAYQPGEWRMP